MKVNENRPLPFGQDTHILRSSVGLSHVCLSLKIGTLGNVATRGLSVSLSLSLSVFWARHSAQCAFAVFCVQRMRTTNRDHRQMMLSVPQSTPWTGDSQERKGRTIDIGSISS